LQLTGRTWMVENAVLLSRALRIIQVAEDNLELICESI
jgi:hypothetical protein